MAENFAKIQATTLAENCASLIPQEYIYVHKISFGTLLSIAPFVFLYTFVLATAVISSGLFVFWAYRKFGLSFVFSRDPGLGNQQDNQGRVGSPTLLSFIDDLGKKLLNGLNGIPSTQNPSSSLDGDNLNNRVSMLRVQIQKRLGSKHPKKKKFNPMFFESGYADSEGESDDLDLNALMDQVDAPISSESMTKLDEPTNKISTDVASSDGSVSEK